LAFFLLRLRNYSRRIISGEGLMRHFLSLSNLVSRLTSGMLLCPFEIFLIANSGPPHRSFAAKFGAVLRAITVALVTLLAHHHWDLTPITRKDPSNQFFACHHPLGKATGQIQVYIRHYNSIVFHDVWGFEVTSRIPFALLDSISQSINAFGNLCSRYTSGDGG
jgi:hypothetical protein